MGCTHRTGAQLKSTSPKKDRRLAVGERRSVDARKKPHSRQFKLECCRAVATGQKRPAQLCREHNLAQSVLLRWRKEYEARGEEAFTESQASSREEVLKAKVAELERISSRT